MIENLLKTISLGPFNIPSGLLSFIAALLLYQLVSRLFYKKNRETLQKIDQILFNTLFIFFVVWKLSPLIFQSKTVINNPLAVMYLPGGSGGLLLGAFGAITYGIITILKHKKDRRIFIRNTGIHFTGFLCLFLLSAFITGFLINETNDKLETRLNTGDRAPDFILEDKTGQEYALSESLGKIRILNFWASWCPPCRAEMPELNTFYNSMDHENAEFISINLSTSEKSLSQLEEYIKNEKLQFPVLYDRTGKVADLYDIKTIPTTIIIDDKGFVINIRKGAVTASMLKNLIK